MHDFEPSGQTSIDFAVLEQPVNSELLEQASMRNANLSDERFIGRLFKQWGENAYFCPNCGNVQGSAHDCSNDCRPNRPFQVMPLAHINLESYISLIRRANPQCEYPTNQDLAVEE